jgi:hypothetical protein
MLKRAAFYVILILWAYGLLEATAAAFSFAFWGHLPSLAEFAAERRQILQAAANLEEPREFGAIPTGDPPGSIYEVLHPYLGFVQDPTRTANYSDLGFPDADVRLYPRDPGRFVIGIFGGSFADGLSRTTKDIFLKILGASPRFAGKEIKVLTLSMGGYKQPQQLLALSYLLSLGAHFDVVVNLDGLNEVALPAVDNVPKGVFPFYPRNWFGRMGTADATMLALSREHAALLGSRNRLAHAFSKLPLSHSLTANVFWKARNESLEREMNAVTGKALAYRPPNSAANYSTRGPTFSYPDENTMYHDLARMWKVSSTQMHRLAAANNIQYLHFLQPNQYLDGTKEMSAQERRVAHVEGHPYQRSVVLGYPKLIAAGQELARNEVPFFDLTRVLSKHQQPLYVDSCCHLGKQGYDIVATRIAEEILRHQ